MNALSIVHGVIGHYIKEGATCIDATAGRGYDTLFLCNTVKDNGRVVAFDIQQSALDSTAKLLKENGKTAELYLDSHANMDKYFECDTVDLIVFNLGYLPYGNHDIYTRFESTKEGIEKGLSILKKGGIMSITIYYGGDSGYEEHDKILPFLRGLDSNKYQVLLTECYNWINDPPIPVFIIKN